MFKLSHFMKDLQCVLLNKDTALSTERLRKQYTKTQFFNRTRFV